MKRVQAIGVAAVEGNLQRVLSDQTDILHAQLFGRQDLDAVEPSRPSGLATASSAWAGPPQALTGVRAVVAILPDDHHHLTLAVYVDGERKRIRVSQLSGPRT